MRRWPVNSKRPPRMLLRRPVTQGLGLGSGAGTFKVIGTSGEPFDRWFRDHVRDVHRTCRACWAGVAISRVRPVVAGVRRDGGARPGQRLGARPRAAFRPVQRGTRAAGPGRGTGRPAARAGRHPVGRRAVAAAARAPGAPAARRPDAAGCLGGAGSDGTRGNGRQPVPGPRAVTIIASAAVSAGERGSSMPR